MQLWIYHPKHNNTVYYSKNMKRKACVKTKAFIQCFYESRKTLHNHKNNYKKFENQEERQIPNERLHQHQRLKIVLGLNELSELIHAKTMLTLDHCFGYIASDGYLRKYKHCPKWADFLTTLQEHRCEGFYKKSLFRFSQHSFYSEDRGFLSDTFYYAILS